MSRACCCSVSHADAISPITTIQDRYRWDAVTYAKEYDYGDMISSTVLEQAVSEWVGGVRARACVNDVCVV